MGDYDTKTWYLQMKFEKKNYVLLVNFFILKYQSQRNTKQKRQLRFHVHDD